MVNDGFAASIFPRRFRRRCPRPARLAPLGVSGGRGVTGLVVSRGTLGTPGGQTALLATSGAISGDASTAPVLQALGQLSETMIMLVGEGELGHARAVHEVIGKLLTSEPPEPGRFESRSKPCRASFI